MARVPDLPFRRQSAFILISHRFAAVALFLLLIALAQPAFGQANYANPYGFTTFAGRAGKTGTNDGAGTLARFYYPTGIGVDSAGNIYVADGNNNTIRKITSGGVVSTLAGFAGTNDFVDGTGSAARFSFPADVAVDGAGNVYVADSGNNSIRKVTPAGVVTTINFVFNNPEGVAVDSATNVYVADTGNHVIRKITPAGVVTVFAGKVGFYGTADGQGTAARFDVPNGVAVDSAGNVYVADSYNGVIRKITSAGMVTTLAGNSTVYGFDDGTGTNALFNYPTGVAVDSAGNVYVADEGNSTIREVTPGGGVTTLGGVAGDFDFANGVGSSALFDDPTDVAVDTAGNLYVADFYNDVIRKGVSSPLPNLTPYQPSGWSDDIVVARTTGTTIDSTNLTTADTLYVSFAAINNGNATASGTFSNYLYVDGVYAGYSFYANLAPNFYTYYTDLSIGSLSAGTHQITMTADATGVIPESNEGDNSYTKTITVSNPGLPNLTLVQPAGWSDKVVVSRTVAGLTDSANLTISDTLYIDWSVTNNGAAATGVTFKTGLYVDGVFNTFWTSAPPLNPGDYVYVTGYSIGSLSAGQHTVEITADYTGLITESDETDNSYTKAFTVTTTTPPAHGPPLVSLAGPANNAVFLAPVNVTNNATASDTNSGGSITRVVFYADTTNKLGSDAATPFSFVWTNAPAGIHFLTAVASNNFGLSATSAVIKVTVNLPPPSPAVFTLGSNNYSVLESNGPVIITVQKSANSLGGTVNYSTVDGSAVAATQAAGNYQGVSGSLVFAPGDTTKSIPIQIINNLVYEGNTTFSFVLSTSGDGSSVGSPGSAVVTIVEVNPPSTDGSMLIHNNPAQPPPGSGQLEVFTQPAGAQGQWRLTWEKVWHNSGDIVTGLPTGNYPVEFSPEAGFIPPADTTNAVVSGSLTSVTNQYAVSGQASYGSLSVTLYPSMLAGRQWQLQGETVWHNSGFVLTNLVAGNHIVEFQNVTGWSSPSPLVAYVGANESDNVAATYLVEQQFTATPPSVLQFNSVIIENFGLPYVYNGQLVTDAGYGSGCVVQAGVVLTAGHMIFDDATLSYVNNVFWFFQEYAGTYNPPAQIPAGAYILDGYAAARTNDLAAGGSPGVETSTAENLDVAALFFLANAGAGGFSGYLVSDSNGTGTQWLQATALKTLVGYPMDDVSTVNMGRMHATSAGSLTFTQVLTNVFSTGDIVGYPGMSGGPLCIQTNGTYYPAGVYLGGTANSIVRAIDGQVAGLITNANISASTGANHGGNGGVPAPIGGGLNLSPGNYQLQISPPAALAAGAGWLVAGQGLSTYYTNTALTYTLPAGTYTITFHAAAGYLAPPDFTLKVTANQTAAISVTYTNAIAGPSLSAPSVSGNVFHLSVGAAVGQKIALERSTNLTTWTPLITNVVPSGGILNLTDAIPANQHAGTFYRTRVVP